MKSTKIIKFSESTYLSRLLTLSIVATVAFLMFGLAYTASAATLYRQLEVGMSGSDVSDLQTFLAQDSTIYPEALVTGYFGLLTQSAVSKFQARNGIATVGRVGPITMNAINIQMGSGNVTGTDRSAPGISSLSISPSNSGATFNWYTNEDAAAIIYYSASPLSVTEGNQNGSLAISGLSLLVHTDLRTSHTATLMGLQSNTTYFYVVYVKDASGNENITWPSIFKTNQ